MIGIGLNNAEKYNDILIKLTIKLLICDLGHIQMNLQEKFRLQHAKYSGAIAYLSVIDQKTEDYGVGTAFHVGDGIFVTAKHVVEGKRIDEIATTKRAYKIKDNDTYFIKTENFVNPQYLKLIDGPRYSLAEDAVDVAVFKVDLNGIELPRLVFDLSTNHDIDDNMYLLDTVLVIGYPPIPCTLMPIQISSLGQVNAVVDIRQSEHPHFIISSLARGGYSGGPVFEESGKVIGIVTDSLVHNNNATENGFMTVLCAEAVMTELQNHYPLNSSDVGVTINYDPSVEINLRSGKTTLAALNPRIPDAVISVIDIDPDACGHIYCEDSNLLMSAIALLESLCEVDKWEEYSNTNTYTFYSHSYGQELRQAAFALKSLFLNNGYVEMTEVDRF